MPYYNKKHANERGPRYDFYYLIKNVLIYSWEVIAMIYHDFFYVYTDVFLYFISTTAVAPACNKGGFRGGAPGARHP